MLFGSGWVAVMVFSEDVESNGFVPAKSSSEFLTPSASSSPFGSMNLMIVGLLAGPVFELSVGLTVWTTTDAFCPKAPLIVVEVPQVTKLLVLPLMVTLTL